MTEPATPLANAEPEKPTVSSVSTATPVDTVEATPAPEPIAPHHPTEQKAVAPPTHHREQKAVAPPTHHREQSGKILQMHHREQKPQVIKTQQVRKRRTVGSKPTEKDADWLKNLLPEPTSGWWTVEANGKGFIIRFRWRTAQSQPTMSFPRVSREEYDFLKRSNQDVAKSLIADRIHGHIYEIIRDPNRADRGRFIAAWIGLDVESDRRFSAAG